MKSSKEILLYTLIVCIMNFLMFLISNSLNNNTISFDNILLYNSLIIFLSILLHIRTKRIYVIMILSIIFICEILIVLYLNPLQNYMFLTGDEYLYRELSTILSDTGRLPSIKDVQLTSYIYICIINIIYFIFDSDVFIKVFNVFYFIIGLFYLNKTLKYFFLKESIYLTRMLVLISPLGIWFANSYYKDSFLFLILSLFLYKCTQKKYKQSFIFLIIAVLNRPGYIFPMLFCLLLFKLGKGENIQFGKLLRIVTCLIFVFLIVNFTLPDLVSKYISWLSISEGRIGDIFGNVALNSLLLPVWTIISATQPMIVFNVDYGNVYHMLDIVGNVEGVLTVILLPYFIFALVNYKGLESREKLFIKIGFGFYFSLAMIGYIFTYRHLTFVRFFYYCISSVGMKYIYNSKSFRGKYISVIGAILYILVFFIARNFIFVRG